MLQIVSMWNNKKQELTSKITKNIKNKENFLKDKKMENIASNYIQPTCFCPLFNIFFFILFQRLPFLTHQTIDKIDNAVKCPFNLNSLTFFSYLTTHNKVSQKNFWFYINTERNKNCYIDAKFNN